MLLQNKPICLYRVELSGEIPGMALETMNIYLGQKGCNVVWDFAKDFSSAYLIASERLGEGDVDAIRGLGNVSGIEAIL